MSLGRVPGDQREGLVRYIYVPISATTKRYITPGSSHWQHSVWGSGVEYWLVWPLDYLG